MKKIVALILAVMLCAGLAAPAMAADKNFSDVPSSHWAYAEIQSAVSDGITTGYSDGTFKPTASVTYAHFAAFLARAFYPSEIDLTITPWYKPYTNVLAAHGILDNTLIDSDLAANINQPINRYEMAKMMYNIISSKGLTIPSPGEAIAIADAGLDDLIPMPVYYRIPVATCYALGVLNGQSDGSFGGQNLMNRAQGCVVICRLYKILDGESTSVTPTKPAEPTKPTNTDTPAAPSTVPDNTSSGTPAQPDQTTPTTEEFCAEVIRLVNVERANEGLAPLSTFDSLTEAAEIRAPELPELFSHTRPDGSTCFTALNETGASKGAYTMGENIAAGQSTPAAVVESWMNSPGHRANILNGDFTHIGVGYIRVDSGYRHYWVQMFVGK